MFNNITPSAYEIISMENQILMIIIVDNDQN